MAHDSSRIRRQAPERRLAALARASCRLLGTTSLKRVQMADIAAATEVSVGTVYRFVESKEALLPLVLRWTLDGPWTPDRLPLSAQPVTETAAWLRTRLDFRDFPQMDRALELERCDDVSREVAHIAEEMFDVLYRVRPVAALLTVSARDYPSLGEVFLDVRAQLLARVERYLAARAAGGQLRNDLDVAISARLFFELVGWAALRRDEWPDTGPRETRSELRAATVQFVVHSLTQDQREEAPA